MKHIQFSQYETNIINLIAEGFTKLQDIKDRITFEEFLLEDVITSLVNKNIISFDDIKMEYVFDEPLKDEKMLLNGNVLLPVTIIKKKDCMLINRGKWYRFPPDFDYRRIIWNVELPNNKRSTILQLITDNILTPKKTKVKQSDKYKELQGKIVPFSDDIKIKLNVVGDEVCDVTIIFIIELNNNGIEMQFREFTVKSSIKTIDLINELNKESSQRNFQNIELKLIYDFSDFLFTGNSIPLKIEKNENNDILEYVNINYNKGLLILKTYQLGLTANPKLINTEEFDDIIDGTNYLRELFKGSYASTILTNNTIFIEDL